MVTIAVLSVGEKCAQTLLLAIGEVQIIDVDCIEAGVALEKNILRIVMPLDRKVAFGGMFRRFVFHVSDKICGAYAKLVGAGRPIK